jgi:chorismate synthase
LGRHDPCLAPRLAPAVEAMCLIVLADFYLAGPDRI